MYIVNFDRLASKLDVFGTDGSGGARAPDELKRVGGGISLIDFEPDGLVRECALQAVLNVLARSAGMTYQ